MALLDGENYLLVWLPPSLTFGAESGNIGNHVVPDSRPKMEHRAGAD